METEDCTNHEKHCATNLHVVGSNLRSKCDLMNCDLCKCMKYYATK